MIIIDVIKIFEDQELYAMHKLYYRENDIKMSSTLYTSKETAQAVIDGILEFLEKINEDVKVRWIYPELDKLFYSKGGVNDE